MSLYKKIINGSLWGIIGNAGYQISGLIIFVIISRILSPVDFGTAALAIVFVELTKTLVSYGLIQVIIRSTKTNIDNTENNVFMTTLIIGIVTSLLFLISATYIESIFDAPGLAISLQILSIVPLMQALSTIPEALLRKDFKFKAIAIRLLGSSILAGAIAIYLAYNDFGFYSLIIQRIISTALALLLLWRGVTWRPKLQISYSNFISTLKQGQPIMLSGLIGQGIFRFVDLTIGFFLGVATLGYFKIAGKLLDVIVQFTLKPIVDVSFSAFSKLKKDPVELEKCYLNFIKMCSIFSFPAFIGVYVVGPEVVILAFGEKWADSGLILQILCLGGIFSTLNYFFAPLCHATNNSNMPLKIRLVEFCVVTTLVLIFSQHSIYYVVTAIVFVSFCITITMLMILKNLLSFTIIRVIKNITPALLSSILMGIIVHIALQSVLQEMNSIIKICCGVVLGCICYALLYRVLFPKEVSKIFVNLRKLRVKS
ncbi:MAG: teichuronic acid exporter [Patiriisocius sp.]|jgi:teichuronic acid exporter